MCHSAVNFLNGLSLFRKTLVRLFPFLIAVCMQHAVGSGKILPMGQADHLCQSGALSWDCYGAMEVMVSMIGGDESKLIPFSRLIIHHFSNNELWVESDSFPENAVQIYFVAMPSKIELFQGWGQTERPFEVVLKEQASVVKILKAAFPDGPGSVGKQRQTVMARVTKYVYPIGEKSENIAVIAYKTDEGEIQTQFNASGEPMGPYQIRASWRRRPLAPLGDGYSVKAMKTKLGRKYETLAQARSLP